MQSISSLQRISLCENDKKYKDSDNVIVNKTNECFLNLDLTPTLTTEVDNKFEVIDKDSGILQGAIEIDPVFVCENIKTFNILDEKTRADAFIASFNGVKCDDQQIDILNTFDNFELKDPEILFHVVLSITADVINISLIYENINIFKLSEDQRIQLFYQNIDNSNLDRHKEILLNLKKLKIENKDELIQIARYLAKNASASYALCPCIEVFEIEDINIRKELFLLCFKNSSNQQDLEGIIEEIENFKIDDEPFLLEFSNQLIQKNFNAFIKSQQLTKKLTQNQLIDFSIEIMNKFAVTSIDTFSYLTPQSKQALEEKIERIGREKILEWNAKNGISEPDTLKKMFDVLSSCPDLKLLSSTLKRYEEQDRIAIAQICAKRNPAFLFSNMGNFAITNQSALFKIASFIAEETPEILSKNIDLFTIQDGNDRMRIAEIVMRKNMNLFNRFLPKFNLSENQLFSCISNLEWKELNNFSSLIQCLSEMHRFEIAKQFVKKHPAYFCIYSNFYLFPRHYAEICLEILDVDPSLIYEIIGNSKNYYSPLRDDDYFELVKKNLDQDIDKFIEDYIKLFKKYLNADHKMKIAKMIAEKDYYKFFKNIVEFDIDDPQELINFARLAIEKKESINDMDSVLISVLHIAINKNPVLAARSIKGLNIQNTSIKNLISQDLAQANIGVFCTYIKELGITENALLFKLAQQAVKTHVKAICQNIHKFSLTEEQRLSILKLAAEQDAMAAAESIQKFGKIQDKELLKKIARSAILQDRSKIEKLLPYFDLKNANEIDAVEIEELLVNMANKKESLVQEQLYKFDAHLLKLCGERLYHALKTNKTSFYANWTCKFLERAAKLYQRKGDSQKAIELRLFIAQVELIYPENPLSCLDAKLQNPIRIPHPKEDINYGAAFSSMGSQELKGGHFRVRDIILDNQGKRVATFNLTRCAAEEVRMNLRLLKQPDLAKLIENGLNTTLEIDEDKNFCYYTAINGKYDSTHPGKIETSPVLTVHLKGLAKIQIGTDVYWGSMIDKVHCTFEAGASPADLQKVFSIMGLANMMAPSTDADIERLKVNFLIHFFYPKIAAKKDNQSNYFETPIPQLLKELEKEPEGAGLPHKIYKYLNKLEFYEIDGERRLRLKDLSDKAERLGARGLYTGIFGKSIANGAEIFASIMQSGFIPTEQRLELGWTDSAGASMMPDLQSGGAIAGFYRIITQSAINKPLPPFNGGNLNGFMQILFKTKVLKLMPYFHSKDSYGSRNPHTTNSNIPRNAYTTRPNLREFLKDNEKFWEQSNEVMLKGRLSPEKYIAGIMYQDPRKILVANIEEKFSSGELLNHRNFFSGCTTLKEKIQFVSDNPNDVLTVLKCLPHFDHYKNTYRGYDVLEHWTVDPELAIRAALEKDGVPYNDLLIQESNTFSNQIFLKCNNMNKQLEKVKRKAMTIAGAFQTNNMLGSQITDDASKLIDAIRKHFGSLSEADLQSYVTEEAIQKITHLRKACRSHLYDLVFSGQDSLNRELLAGKWNSDLKDQEVILALFALEAIQEKNSSAATNSLIEFSVNTTKNYTRTISECLYRGLKTHHPALLEKLPNNAKSTANSLLASQVIFLGEYIRRSNIKETFLPILIAINQAYEKVLNKAPDLTPQRKEAALNVAYESKYWKDNYLKILNTILDVIDRKSDQEILTLMAKHKYSPSDLKSQVLHGLKDLITKENLKTEEMTVEEIVHTITTSFFLLDPLNSHAFYDRLHLLAALKSNDPIAIKDGHITMRDLMIRIMHSFKEGVTDKNAIAAEQFYLRMVFLYEKLSLL
jgi:hypothetical protein